MAQVRGVQKVSDSRVLGSSFAIHGEVRGQRLRHLEIEMREGGLGKVLNRTGWRIDLTRESTIRAIVGVGNNGLLCSAE